MNTQPTVPDADSDPATTTSPMSPVQTREKLLELARRGYSVHRSILVQMPDRDQDRVSTVGHLTTDRHHRALVLYLLVLTWWPWLHDRDTPLDSEVWLRALTVDGPGTAGALTWSASTLSRTWGELKKYKLIETKREGRLTRITPRREDGNADYAAPAGEKDFFNRYFTIPDEFWTQQHFATLSPAALAVLLMVLKETAPKSKPDVELPRKRMKEWYGISGKTVTDGIKELTDAGLMAEPRLEKKQDPAAKFGVTLHYYYGLVGPFSTEERIERRRKARRKWNQNERKKAKEPAAKEKS